MSETKNRKNGIKPLDVIGYTASALSILTYASGVITIYLQKDVGGTSIVMFSIAIVANSFWLIYGLGTKSWPNVFSGALIVLLASLIVIKILASRKAKLQSS